MKRTHYRLRMLIAAVVMLGCRAVSADSVVWGDALLDIQPSTQWSTLWVSADDGENGYGSSVQFKLDYSSGVALLSAYNHANMGAAKSWRQMDIGDEVGSATMTGKDKKYFYSNGINDSAGVPTNDYGIEVKNGESVYLGFYETWGKYGSVSGWVELIYDGTALSAEQCAVDWSGHSIIIQPRQIPEPCTAALLALGVCACALRRKDAA